jgi:hypothetical protein
MNAHNVIADSDESAVDGPETKANQAGLFHPLARQPPSLGRRK